MLHPFGPTSKPDPPLAQPGEVVAHKRMDYFAVVLGVDEECTASAEWQKRHRVSFLSRGSKQRFYHLLPDIPAPLLDTSGDFAPLPEKGLPAFFLYNHSGEAEWPRLVTTYVAEDLLYPYQHTRDSMGSLYGGPVQNPLVQELFCGYARGRYQRDEEFGRSRFVPVTDTLIMLSLWEMANSQPSTHKQEGQAHARRKQTLARKLLNFLLLFSLHNHHATHPNSTESTGIESQGHKHHYRVRAKRFITEKAITLLGQREAGLSGGAGRQEAPRDV